MSTKRDILAILENHPTEYLSGNYIADQLHITRAAVWKNVQSLISDGVAIDAARTRGYRLSELNDAISGSCVRKYVTDKAYSIDARGLVTSTNQVLKEHASELPAWRVVIAGQQSAGRGRLGRRFYSPSGTGLYISVLLRPTFPAEEATLITTAAAVAVCKAVEDCGGGSPLIKWVNDVYLNDRKICGILTEASLNVETGALDYAILGVGINVYEPDGGFPEDIRNIAGAVFTERRGGLRCRLAASFLNRFKELYDNLRGREFVSEYKKRSFLIGKPITVIRPTGTRDATALDIDDACRMIVRYADGTVETLSYGDVSVRQTGGRR